MSLLDQVRNAPKTLRRADADCVAIPVDARDALVEFVDATLAMDDTDESGDREAMRVAGERVDVALERLRR